AYAGAGDPQFAGSGVAPAKRQSAVHLVNQLDQGGAGFAKVVARIEQPFVVQGCARAIHHSQHVDLPAHGCSPVASAMAVRAAIICSACSIIPSSSCSASDATMDCNAFSSFGAAAIRRALAVASVSHDWVCPSALATMYWPPLTCTAPYPLNGLGSIRHGPG